jgi:hypothetical protein
MVFFEDVLPMRLSASGVLASLAESAGFTGDPHTKEIRGMGDGEQAKYPTAWLPTRRTALAWQAVETDKPFEP